MKYSLQKLPLIIWSVFLIALFSLETSHAGTGSYNPSTDTGFYFSVGPKIVYGTMASGDSTTVGRRNLIDYAAEANVGYKYSSVILALGGEYGLWRQLTNPAAISNSNTQGRQTNLTGILGYDFNWVSILTKYIASSRYSLDKSNASGQKVAYSNPNLSYSVQVSFLISEGSSLGIEYTQLRYTRQPSGGASSSLASDAQIRFHTLGVVYDWLF